MTDFNIYAAAERSAARYQWHRGTGFARPLVPSP